MEDEKGKEIRWRKIGGGSLRYIRRRIIKPNERFIAREDEIPSAFREYVVALEDLPQTEVKEEAKEEVKENPTKTQYEMRTDGGGWWDIINVTSGKPINEKKLRKADAEKVLRELL